MSSDAAYAPESEFRPGQIFAERYKLRRLLRSDIVSHIFEADDLTLKRPVALKVIRSSLVERKRDISVYRLDLNRMRQIVHERVLRVFDSGEYAGHYYVATETLDGISLQDFFGHGKKVPLSEFFRLVSQLSEAMRQLHAHNIIHRDLNPATVVITPTGDLKLLDFSIDRDLKHLANASTGRDHEFAAPEQTEGRAATAATDIYSLGAISHFMLTGTRPQLRSAAFRPDVRASLEREPQDLPSGIAAVLQRCLRRDPDERYQTIGDFNAAISTAQEQDSTYSDGPQPQRTRLGNLQKDAPQKPQKVLWLFLKVIARLQDMHAAGQPHSELAPQKIWLDGDRIEIEQSLPVTGKGTLLIAEPRYSAPELLLALTTPDSASHEAADIYVLGFLMYEFLAGRNRLADQFPDISGINSGLGWMRWHADLHQTLRPLTQIIPDLPEALSELVERMVQKDPSKRIRSLDQVEAELKGFASRLEHTDQFLVAAPGIPAPAAPKRSRSKAAAAVLASAVLIAAAGFAVWSGTGGHWRRFYAALLQNSAGWKAKIAPARERVSDAGRQTSAETSLPRMAGTATGLMLLIPAGEFTMGDDAIPNAAPAHKLALPAFYMDRVEVSNGAYRRFCQRAGRALPPKPTWDPAYLTKDAHPVVNVTWDDAKAFCESSGERLPSEAEWEKAARGTEPFIHWANWSLPGLANLPGPSARQPAAVGSFPSDVSPYGVLDMAGNVQEWVNDSYQPYVNSPDTLSAEDGRKLIRGGSYGAIPEGLSPAWRGWITEGSGPAQSPLVGFRCAADSERIIASAH